MTRSYNLSHKIIYLKVEDAYAVWFKASGAFLMIEEPAFHVLELLLNETPVKEIVQKFSDRYDHPIGEIQKFVPELIESVQQYLVLNDSDNQKDDLDLNLDLGENLYSEKIYAIGKSVLKINYGEPELEDVIHPLIAHFEAPRQMPTQLFEILKGKKKIIFNANGECIEQLNFNETGFLKAAVLLKLLGILYGIKKDDWMMTIHAAAVTDGKSAIVFPAMAGSGKSTLATLLHANGFHLLSDDFLAMDLHQKKVYELPVAATIKEGSFKVLSAHFPELNTISTEKAYTGKQVRYLPVNHSLDYRDGFLAKSYVFINYSADNTFTFNEVSKKIAMKRLLEETWVNPAPSTISEFFNWFDETKFYEMRYTNISDALKVVQHLFNN